MKVSIVIPVYNMEKTVAETIESALRQTRPAHEIIVVNDGSADSSREVASRYPVKIIDRVAERKGVAPVRNLGFAFATGDAFLPLDADDLIDSEYLEKTVPVMEAYPKCGIVCTDIQYFGTKNHKIRSLWLHGFPMTKEMEYDHNNIPVCSLIRAEAFRQVGGYDERMWAHEDWSLWISLLSHGWEAHAVHELLFFYRVRENSYATIANNHRKELNKIMRDIHGDIFKGYIGGF